MKNLPQYLDRAAYIVLLFCLAAVAFAFTIDRFHPFDAIKELLFHFCVLLAGFLLAARAILSRNFPVDKNALHVLVLLYLGYNAVSFFLFPYTDDVYFVNLTLLVLLFYVVSVAVNSEKRYRNFLYTLAFITLVSSFYGFAQFAGYDYHRFQGYFAARFLGTRVFSFFGNPNLFAAFLVASIPWLLSGFFTEKRSGRRFFGLAALLAFVALCMTGTRAAIAASIVSLGLFVMTTLGKPHRKRYIAAVSTTVVLLIGGFFVLLKADGFGLTQLRFRQYWHQAAFKITQDHPLFGTGVGTFGVYYPEYRKKSEEADLGFNQHEVIVNHPHSEYLEILSELGILGFLLFISIVVVYFGKYYVNWNPNSKFLLAGNYCSVMGLLAHNVYSISLRYVSIAILFWVGLGLQSALLSDPETRPPSDSRKYSLSPGKGRVVVSLLLAPLLALFFFNYSLKRFSGEYFLRRGMGLSQLDNHRWAEDSFKKALDYYPRDKTSLYFLAISQHRLGKYNESNETLSALSKVDPNFLQSHYWMASNYFEARDFEKAKEEYMQSLKLNDAYGPAYYALGVISLTENDLKQALDYFEYAYSLPGDSSTQRSRRESLRNLVQIHRQLGNDEEARTYAGKLRELEAKTTSPAGTMGSR